MKKLFYILLLCSYVVQAQEYSFETIDKCLDAHEWEIREIAGTVSISDSTIVIKTQYNIHVLKIDSALQLYSQDDKIFTCADEVKVRLRCDDKLRRYFDLLYYSNEPNNKYFRFCLKRI